MWLEYFAEKCYDSNGAVLFFEEEEEEKEENTA